MLAVIDQEVHVVALVGLQDVLGVEALIATKGAEALGGVSSRSEGAE